MMVGDPIADMLTRIKNASAVQHKKVSVPYSSLKFAIAGVLRKQGFLGDISRKGRQIGKTIEITLVYDDSNKTKIKNAERISKPSRRVYFGVKDIKPIMNGYGKLILSTPKGILTGEEARRALVGGEVLFKIW
ncbi:30S ribosomal protein S8 [Patescibacteria group bacterium]|nr:30S ribosomal protein S8 [Patescibacteria group bacterium]MBU1246830.1 30S ribosomal protein S8 [Patescibacteria group bacterium]MBU1519625.1 30S ribosomal protein S8 [Patescibacteria group bacterium]MBU1730592.1 30S ribosomal protein S8 [Patescibacteria group bacterium]MBU1956451.1 30S ribosomal protein S8 [Patescibacteria group bacterium]